MDRFHPAIDRAMPSSARRMADRRWLYLSARDATFAAESWPRCTLVLIADEPRRSNLPPFHPRENRVGWDGPRSSVQPACGGGRRILRKHDPFS